MFFFFNDTATTEIYTLSLHDALPISAAVQVQQHGQARGRRLAALHGRIETRRQQGAIARRNLQIIDTRQNRLRSEEHTSELQSPCNLVCRLLLEKKKNQVKLSKQSPSSLPSLTATHSYAS